MLLVSSILKLFQAVFMTQVRFFYRNCQS